MSYGIILAPEAEKDLNGLPHAVALFVARQLTNLAESPAALSRRSHFPFRERCQVMACDYDDDAGHRWFINVLFQYSQDEANLHVLGIASQSVDEWLE
jgi:hypothetical protein